MWRVLFFLIKLAVLGAIAVWLYERPGSFVVEWLGYRLETPVGIALLALLLLIVLAALVYRLWRALVTAPRKIRHARVSTRRRHGYRALTQGMVAVAAGDAAEARRQQRRAETLLDEPPLTLLLAAQAAQLEGDETAARRYFEEMLKRPDTAFLGVRGLLMQAMRTGDTTGALRWAAQAHADRPNAAWATKALLDLQLEAGHFEAAEQTLREAARGRVIGEAEADRRRAVLLADATLRADHRSGQALSRAREAVKLAPDLVPARLALSRLLSDAGRRREAARVIEQAWTEAPHPALAAAFAALEPSEKPLDRVRRFDKLVAAGPQTREAHLTLAKVGLDAGLWGPARQHLEQALAAEGCEPGAPPVPAGDGSAEAAARALPSARLSRLMARLAEGDDGDPAAVRRWLFAATLGAPEPAWVCERCGTPAAAWSARCGHCRAFDSLRWRDLPRLGEIALLAPPAIAAQTGPADGATGEAVGPTALQPAEPPSGSAEGVPAAARPRAAATATAPEEDAADTGKLPTATPVEAARMVN